MRDFRQAFRMMREVCKVANILVCDDDKDIVEAISISGAGRLYGPEGIRRCGGD